MNTTQNKRDTLIQSALTPLEYFRSANNEKTKAELQKLTESIDSNVTYYVPPEDRNKKDESFTQSEIIKYLKAKGWFVQKFKPVNLVGRKGDMRLAATDRGIPDVLCCYNGRFIAFEVKAARVNAQVSNFQQRAIARIRACGGYAYVIHSIKQIEAITKDTQDFTISLDTPLVLTHKMYLQGHSY